MNDASVRPSKVRYLIVLVTFLAAFLLYVHRFCFSYTQQYIKEDLSISNDQFAYCLSAFFFAYALAQVPSGWISDRFGARTALTAYILLWSLFTALLGATLGLIMLVVVRVAIGLGQAGAYPTSAALIKRWFPVSSRATASSFVAYGGRLGVGVTPIITAYLIVWLVPMDREANLKRSDLLHPHLLCYQLQQALPHTVDTEVEPKAQSDGRLQVRRRLIEQFDAKAREAVHYLANGYALRLAEIKNTDHSKKSKNSKELVPRTTFEQAPSSDVQRILDELNRQLTNPNLYVSSEFVEISIEREAKELCQRNVSQLSPQQLARRNRLLLEAVFPESIRKLYGQGWRPMMFIYGSMGLLVAAAFWLAFRESPSKHPWCNDHEIEQITGVSRSVAATFDDAEPHSTAVPIIPILKSRSLWLMCLNQWCGNVGWLFLVTWLPRYLYEIHQVPLVERGWMAAIPLWCGWAGMLTGGRLSDYITGRFGLRWRTGTVVIGRCLGTLAYLSCLLHPSAWVITIAFSVVAFSADMSNPSSWAYKMDVGGRHVGAIHGWANMWGNLGATVSPLLLQFVVREYSWDAAFLTCAAAFGTGAIAAFFVDARIPIVPEEESA